MTKIPQKNYEEKYKDYEEANELRLHDKTLLDVSREAWDKIKEKHRKIDFDVSRAVFLNSFEKFKDFKLYLLYLKNVENMDKVAYKIIKINKSKFENCLRVAKKTLVNSKECNPFVNEELINPILNEKIVNCQNNIDNRNIYFDLIENYQSFKKAYSDFDIKGDFEKRFRRNGVTFSDISLNDNELELRNDKIGMLKLLIAATKAKEALSGKTTFRDYRKHLRNLSVNEDQNNDFSAKSKLITSAVFGENCVAHFFNSFHQKKS